MIAKQIAPKYEVDINQYESNIWFRSDLKY